MSRLLPDPAQVAAFTAAIPLQRWGIPDDIANAGVFLFSEAASWVTGTVLIVDGGAVSFPFSSHYDLVQSDVHAFDLCCDSLAS